MNHLVLLFCSAAIGVLAEPAPLTLEQALAMARGQSPRLRAARGGIDAAAYSASAAGLWRNPEIDFDAEGLGIDNDPYRDGEYTLAFRQEFLFGGKRAKERAVAQKGIDLAQTVASAEGVELELEVRQAFWNLLSQQEIDALRSDQEELARAFLDVAQRHYRAGGGSELEVVQAELALEEVRLARTCCLGDLAAARIALASLLGVAETNMVRLAGPYYELPDAGRPGLVPTHPLLRNKAAEAELLRAQAVQLRANDVPDVKLSVGYRREAADDVDSMVLGAMFPLNFVRKGKAEAAVALQQAAIAEAERSEILRRLESGLAATLERYKGACIEAESTRTQLLPKAEKAYELSRAGYEAGRFSWLELIAAQQHLAEIRVRLIEALLAAHLERTQLHRYLPEGFLP